MKKILINGLIALACAGCSSCIPEFAFLHSGPRTLDVLAKSFSAAPDKANIYVIEVRQCSGFAEERCVVFLDGTEVGEMRGGCYRFFRRPPKEHSIGVGWCGWIETAVVLTAEAGENYFVLFTEHASAGKHWWQPGEHWYTVEIVGEDEGRNLVLKSTLAGKTRGLRYSE